MIVFALTTEEIKDKNSQIETLINGIALGERSALKALYALIQTDVFAYALSKMGNKQDAADVMQDTFIQIFKYAKQYKPMGKPMAWIFTIEHNLIRRQFQLKNRTVNFEEHLGNVAEDCDVEEQVINSEFLKMMLYLLSEEEREIIALHLVSGMKHREIAKILGKPLSSVLSKYNRAIKKLQIIVKEEK